MLVLALLLLLNDFGVVAVADGTCLGFVFLVGVGLGLGPVGLGSAYETDLDEAGALGLGDFDDNKAGDGIPDEEGVLVGVQVDVKVCGLDIRHGGGVINK